MIDVSMKLNLKNQIDKHLAFFNQFPSHKNIPLSHFSTVE